VTVAMKFFLIVVRDDFVLKKENRKKDKSYASANIISMVSFIFILVRNLDKEDIIM
jgi:hypothetical protein